MILTGKDIIGTKVISIKEGAELGTVKDIVYSPKENKVIAFLLTSGDVITEPNAVSFSEIKEITNKAVLVKGNMSIKPASKVVKPSSTPESKDTFMKGTEIVSDDGSILGHEKDIRFDTASGEVKEFVVISGGQETSIPVSSIVTSTPSTTIIKLKDSQKSGNESSGTGIFEKVKQLIQ